MRPSHIPANRDSVRKLVMGNMALLIISENVKESSPNVVMQDRGRCKIEVANRLRDRKPFERSQTVREAQAQRLLQ